MGDVDSSRLCTECSDQVEEWVVRGRFVCEKIGLMVAVLPRKAFTIACALSAYAVWVRTSKIGWIALR